MNQEKTENKDSLQKISNNTPTNKVSPSAEQEQTIPPEVTKVLTEFQAMSGPVFPPFMHKIDSKHLSDIIQNADKEDERQFKSKQSARRYGLVYALLGLALVVFFTFYLAKESPDLFRMVLAIILSGGVSFIGGYGLGSKKRS